MRFKSIFWLFNGIVILAFLLIALVPLFVLGEDYLAAFWGNMWFVAALFFLLIIVMDSYFLINWRLFTLLESEDWPGLLSWLEERIYGRKRLNRLYAGLLVNTALSVSNLDVVRKLEKEISQRRPSLLRPLGVSLGIPVLLDRKAEAIVDYFGPLAEDKKTRNRDWARWCVAFARIMEGETEIGNGQLFTLLESHDLLIRLLSYHLLQPQFDGFSAVDGEKMTQIGQELRGSLSGSAGERTISRAREDSLMAVVLAGLITEARDSLDGHAS